MEALQREIEDERKSRLTYFPQHTAVGSLGCWGSPAGLTTSTVGFGTEITTSFRHKSPRILDMPVPTLSSECGVSILAFHRGDASPSSPGPREREMEWRRTHAETLRQFENQWVVLEGERIIAHDSNAAQAIRQAKSRGIRTPYVFFVEPESDESVRIGL